MDERTGAHMCRAHDAVGHSADEVRGDNEEDSPKERVTDVAEAESSDEGGEWKEGADGISAVEG